MEAIIRRFEGLLKEGNAYISNSKETDLSLKPSAEKWSKKEILGHLIDSGINNLQRFTEIQFENKPYKIKEYKQDELVKANNYQNASTDELIAFWLAVNNRIMNLIKQQREANLNYEIELDNETKADLRFLIEDYVDHLEHHLRQITA